MTSLSGHGKLIVGRRDVVRVWREGTGRMVNEYALPDGSWKLSAWFDPDGRLLAAGFNDDTVTVWEVETGSVVAECRKHKDDGELQVSHDGRLLALSSKDLVIKVRKMGTVGPIVECRGHTGSIRSICFSQDGKRLASGGEDQAVRVWDVETGCIVADCPGHSYDEVRGACFSADGQLIASAGPDSTVRLWQPTTKRIVAEYRSHGSAKSFSFSPDGQLLATCGNQPTVHLWAAGTGELRTECRGRTVDLKDVCLDPSWNSENRWYRSGLVVSGREEFEVRMWGTSTGERVVLDWVNGAAVFPQLHGCVAKYRKYWDNAKCVCFSPDGRMLASGGNGIVWVWEAETGELVTEFGTEFGKPGSRECEIVRSLCFSPDNRLIATTDDRDAVRVWAAETGELVARCERRWGGVSCVCFSPDSQLVASGGEDETVRVWEARTGRVVGDFGEENKGDWSRSVCFSPDGRLVASANFIRQPIVQAWEIGTGRPVAECIGHHGWVKRVCFSTDGKLLASAADDQTVRMWDVRSSRCVNILFYDIAIPFVSITNTDPPRLLVANSIGRGYCYEMRGHQAADSLPSWSPSHV